MIAQTTTGFLADTAPVTCVVSVGGGLLPSKNKTPAKSSANCTAEVRDNFLQIVPAKYC